MTGPTIEQVQIYGYDARDVATQKIENHEGIICEVANAVDGQLDTGNTIALYLRNLGNQPVVINEVNVFGFGVTETAGGLDNSTPLPGTGQWTIVTVDGCTSITTKAGDPIAIGDDATILIGWDDSEFGIVKVGRPIFASIETAAGNIFTKNMIYGRSVG